MNSLPRGSRGSGTPATEADVPKVIAPPIVLFIAALGVAYAGERLWPLPPLTDLDLARVLIFCGCMAAAFLIAASALLALRRAATPADPHEPTTALVTSGPYRLSRNPLYVSLLLVYLAFTLLLDSRWMAVLLPALFIALHAGVVLPEERYLRARFGEQYSAYVARVRRWL